MDLCRIWVRGKLNVDVYTCIWFKVMKFGVVAHNCSCSIWEIKTEEYGITDQLLLCREFWPGLDYMVRLCTKKILLQIKRKICICKMNVLYKWKALLHLLVIRLRFWQCYCRKQWYKWRNEAVKSQCSVLRSWLTTGLKQKQLIKITPSYRAEK